MKNGRIRKGKREKGKRGEGRERGTVFVVRFRLVGFPGAEIGNDSPRVGLDEKIALVAGRRSQVGQYFRDLVEFVVLLVPVLLPFAQRFEALQEGEQSLP